jgi:hypothetical protein
MDAGERQVGRLAERLRRLLAWAGVLTLAAITLMAAIHLVADVREVLSIRGGVTVLASRLLPAFVLALGGLAAAVACLLAADRGRLGERLAMGAGFGVLVVLRVILAASSDGVPLGEPQWYGLLADGVLRGECCFADRPMGYPILLTGVELVLGERRLSVAALNIMLALAAGGAVLGLARAAYGARAGVLALLGYAVWPAGALMVPVGIPQGAYDLGIVAAAWVAVGTPPGWRGSAATGLLLGLAQYLRPTTPVLVPAFLLARLWPGSPWRAALLGAATPMLAAFLVVVAPAIAHNLRAYGEFSVSTSSFSGHTLFVGTDIASGGRYDREAAAALTAAAGPDVRAQGEVAARIALERIRDDPLGIALLGLRKQVTLWATERFGVEYGISRRLSDQTAHPKAVTALLLSQAFYVLVMAGATAWVALRWRRLDALAAFAIVLVWTVAGLHALAEVRDRYHSYVIPVLLPLAAAAAVSLLDRAQDLRRRIDGGTMSYPVGGLPPVGPGVPGRPTNDDGV